MNLQVSSVVLLRLHRAMDAFLGWWLGELRTFVPRRWRASLFPVRTWTTIERVANGWSVGSTEREEGTFVGDEAVASKQYVFSRDPETWVVLLLPSSVVLRRRLVLPLAARDSLHRVAAYELDRHTPFRADQVRYDVRALREPAPEGRFVAELLVVPLATIDEVLRQSGEAGIALDAMCGTKPDIATGLNLLPPSGRRVRRKGRGRLNFALAGVATVLAFAAMVGYVHNRDDALIRMRAEVAALRVETKSVEALRKQLNDGAGADGFFAARKSASAPVLAVLAELTQRLPDDTSVERVTIAADGTVGWQGQSPQAARLVDALKGADTLGEPSFQGSIQTDPTTSKERFYMVAHVRKAKEAGHAPASR
ncbi:general secretion pathway protein L [Luteibacter rhizovicinus]|uniref:General secretion pathway protein L n=1 Tax=Luteibacter rhizovicinus TaxID=242606 RepID=A0A4R3YK01_9GAMM|nr:PilN domain-containing protein [Luteibacter rhizovicinus]TCV91053.1 general secretion pathway protein L [Luteibacter rhizovicinus]